MASETVRLLLKVFRTATIAARKLETVTYFTNIAAKSSNQHDLNCTDITSADDQNNTCILMQRKYSVKTPPKRQVPQKASW